jgi:hypothetical protein
MKSDFQPCQEPLRRTLIRTGAIAIIIGAAIALPRGGIRAWPVATLIALWPAFGGHWVELWFLNWLRPRLPATQIVHVAARLATWFVGGAIMAIGMKLTAVALAGSRPVKTPTWWVGGLAFIGIELIVHLVPQLLGRRSFYNGRG